jgi:RiboL-PSP-HEPN
MRSRIGAHQALFDKINHLHSLSKSLPANADNDYVIAELCKYCCVLASAAIDVCMEDCLIEYCDRARDQRVLSYIKDRLGRARNPTIATIGAILEAFDQDWRTRLETFADQRIRSDVGSIVSNRNEIAHGRNSQISFGRLLPWVKSARSLCDHMERIVFS